MLTCPVISDKKSPRANQSPRPRAPTPLNFLIANPRLEFPASTTKQATCNFLIANRLQLFNSALVNPAFSSPIFHRRAKFPLLSHSSLLPRRQVFLVNLRDDHVIRVHHLRHMNLP